MCMRLAEFPSPGKHDPFPRPWVPVTSGANAWPSWPSLNLALKTTHASIFNIMAEIAVGTEYFCAYLPVSFVLLSLTALFNLDPTVRQSACCPTLITHTFSLQFIRDLTTSCLLQNDDNMALSFPNEKGKLHTVVTFNFHDRHRSRIDDYFVETSRLVPIIPSKTQADSVTRTRNDCMNEPRSICLFISKWVGIYSVVSDLSISTGTCSMI